MEQAKLINKDKRLNTVSLDAQLVTAIRRGAAKGDVRAIQMGYQRLGLMRNGEFLGDGGENTIEPANASFFEVGQGKMERSRTKWFWNRLKRNVSTAGQRLPYKFAQTSSGGLKTLVGGVVKSSAFKRLGSTLRLPEEQSTRP